MAAHSQYLVYGLIDPRSSQLRYVGLSSSGMQRPSQHIQPSKLYRKDRKSRKFSHCQNWIQDLVKNGLKYDIVVLENCSSKAELNAAEVFYISYFKSVGADLTNHQPGGYAGRKGGWKHSEETIAKLKASARTRYEKDPSSMNKAIDSRRGIKTPASNEKQRIAVSDSLGNTFYSITVAAKFHKVCPQTVRKILDNKSKSSKGIFFTKMRKE